MRIIFICNEYPPQSHGGIGVFVKNLSEYLVGSHQKVWVIGFDKGVLKDKIGVERGVNVIRLKKRFQNFYKKKWLLPRIIVPILERLILSRRLEYEIKLNKIEFVESYDWSGPLFFKPSIPMIIRLHGANSVHSYFENKDPERLTKYFEKRNIRFSEKQIAVSEFMARLTKDFFNLEKKVEIIYNSVNTKNFFHDPAIKREENQLLFVGRMDERKGVFFLIEMMKILWSEGLEINLRLVGKIKEGVKNQILENIPMHFVKRIEFSDPVQHDQLLIEYNRASVFILPSKSEAFGLTAIEAMSCKTPVIVTSNTSGPEIIIDGEDGILINAEDVIQSAQKIKALFKDKSLQKQIGEAGYQKVVKKFSSDKILRDNLNMYKSFIKRQIQNDI